MLSFLPQCDLIVLLYLSLYCREFLVVGLSSIIFSGLICLSNKSRASGVHDTNPRPQPHQTYFSTPAHRSQLLLPSPNFTNTFTSITEPHHTTVPLSEFWIHGTIGFTRRVRSCLLSQMCTASHRNIEPCWFLCQKDHPFFNAFQIFYLQTPLTIHTPH